MNCKFLCGREFRVVSFRCNDASFVDRKKRYFFNEDFSRNPKTTFQKKERKFFKLDIVPGRVAASLIVIGSLRFADKTRRLVCFMALVCVYFFITKTAFSLGGICNERGGN